MNTFDKVLAAHASRFEAEPQRGLTASYELARDLNRLVSGFNPFSVDRDFVKCELAVQIIADNVHDVIVYTPQKPKHPTCRADTPGWTHDGDELARIVQSYQQGTDAAEEFLAALIHLSLDSGFEAVPRTGVEILLPGDVYMRFDYVNPTNVYIVYLLAYRGQRGAGSKALQVVTTAADQFGVTLTLTADPMTAEDFVNRMPYAPLELRARMSRDDLMRFYERFGFVRTRRYDMVRSPQR